MKDEEKILSNFMQLVRSIALTTVSQQYSIPGKKVRKRLGITSFQLGRIVRKAVEEGRIKGVKVVVNKNRLRFVIDKRYWVK